MDKNEIIEKIKNQIEDYRFQSSIDTYIKGYLDALCHTYEITCEERYEIEEMLNNEQSNRRC